MRAMVYTRNGGADVLELADRPRPEPEPGEVRVRLALAGVNPTDWKFRQNTPPPPGGQVPGQDGAGTIDAVGEGVDAVLLGERVWLWLAAWQRAGGTAAEYTVVPAAQAVLLGAAPFELGAALGVPFVTAHRCLTLGELMPDRLGPGALTGKTVLVQGGAGAVGNAAIQLARWADATVITTVSTTAKARLAAAAGADHIINYHDQDVVHEVAKIVPAGVDAVLEVAPAANAAIDAQVVARHAAVAMYADNSGPEVAIPVRPQMMRNSRWQFVLLYTEPDVAKAIAVQDVAAAVAGGALRVGEPAGLPLQVFGLAQTGAAHNAVQNAAVGKVLIDVTA